MLKFSRFFYNYIMNYIKKYEKLDNIYYKTPDLYLEAGLINDMILLVKIKGVLTNDSYNHITKLFKNKIEIIVKERNVKYLINDFSELSDIQAIPKKSIKDWINNLVSKYNLIYFFGLNVKLSITVNSIRAFSKNKHNIILKKDLEDALIDINEFETTKTKRISENITSFLSNVKKIYKPEWEGQIDNGRLKYKTEVFDGNIIMRTLVGKMFKGDMQVLINTMNDIKKQVLKPNEPYYILFEISKLKAIKIGARKEALNWFLSEKDSILAGGFLSPDKLSELVIKYTLSLTPEINTKIKVYKTLEDGFAEVFAHKNYYFDTHKISKKTNIFKRIFCFKTKRHRKLEEELRKTKEFYDIRLNQLFKMLGQLTWDGNITPPKFDIPEDDPFNDIFNSVSLVFFDVDEIISKRDELINKAKESERLKAAFLSNMSHEIRTPLNGIIGFTDLLVEEKNLTDKQKKYLKIIKHNGENLLVLVNDIMDLSKIEAGQLELKYSKFDLNSMLFEIQETYKAILKTKNKNIEIQYKSNNYETFEITTDKLRLNQILSNLINNAIKYTEEGNINFGFEYIGNTNKIRFYVKDTGIGISKSDINNIFNRFVQLNDIRIEKNTGAGLGLSIAKDLVKLLGGNIWVESEKGKGSIFYFEISQQENNVNHIN